MFIFKNYIKYTNTSVSKIYTGILLNAVGIKNKIQMK